ncbi:MAG: hypothetical protein KDD76_06225, partial [Rickettsiales bacterium]|nr:hypothetical protein [Rickettsiales bacterium]
MAEKDSKSVSTGESESMEDILHSIRDIIASDSENDTAESEEVMPDETKETSGEEEILELTDIVEEDEADNAADTASDILDELDNALEEDDAMATAESAPTQPARPAASPPEEEEMTEAGEELPEMDDDTMDAAAARESLLDDQAASITSKSIKNLMHSIPKPDLNSPALRSGNTVEDL